MFPSLLKDVTLLSVSVLLIAETHLTSTSRCKITLSKLACFTKSLLSGTYYYIHLGAFSFNLVQRAGSLLQWLNRTLNKMHMKQSIHGFFLKRDNFENILPIFAQLAGDGTCKMRSF